MSVSQRMLDEILSGQLDLLRFEASVRRKALAMLEQLRRELAATLVSEDLTAFGKQRTTTMLKAADVVIARHYANMQAVVDKSLLGMAKGVISHTARTLTEPLLLINVAVGLPSQTFVERLVSNTLVRGAITKEWWGRQSRDTAFKFSTAVRQGLANGETNEQIVRRVVGEKTMTNAAGNVWTTPRANIRSLVHSAIQAVSAAARRETYSKNRDIIKGIRQHSTFDSHTTEICIAYSGQEWSIDTFEPLPGSNLPYNGGVPRHWNCRSAEVPILKSFRELGLDMDEPEIGTRASSEGQIRAGTTFAEWLGRRTEAQQDEQLGVGRAQLWRDGKITLTQLLSLDGNPLNLTSLLRKYGD